MLCTKFNKIFIVDSSYLNSGADGEKTGMDDRGAECDLRAE